MQNNQYLNKENLFDGFFFAITLGFFIRASYYYYQIIVFPFQLEFREGLSPLITNAFLSGISPYAAINQPLMQNQYGFLYSFVVLPFSLFLGPTLFAHRLVNLIFILFSCIIVFDICYEKGRSLLYSFCASIILYETFLEHTVSTAFPNALGVCLMLLSVYIPWKFNFSRKSLFFCIVFGISALFTKIYYIFGSICVAIYLIVFLSKKKGIIFSLVLTSTTILTIIIVNKFFDFYFEDTFMVARYCNAGYYSSILHLIKQVCYFIMLYGGLFILMAIITIKKIRLLHNDMPQLFKEGNIMNKIAFSIRNLQNMPFYQLCFIVSCLVMLSLGVNRAAFFSYFAQLITPFMLIVFIGEISKEIINRKIQILLLIVTLLTVAYRYPRNTDFYNSFNLHQFASLMDIVKSHNVMYNSPSLVSIYMECRKNVTDSGQTEYFKFAHTPRAETIYSNYLNDISSKINKKYYEVIFEPSELLIEQGTHGKADIFKFYEKYKTVTIKMLQQTWDVEIWQTKNHAD